MDQGSQQQRAPGTEVPKAKGLLFSVVLCSAMSSSLLCCSASVFTVVETCLVNFPH